MTLAAAAILAAGVWAFSTSFAGVFVLDDVRAIVRNETIRTLSPLSTPLSPPGESTVAGRPVANLSFAVSYALGSGQPGDAWSFHLGNLLIHLAAALVLFGVVRRTLLVPALRPRDEAAAPYLAGAIAAVWVVHPLQTESVTYVVQRVESLMGLFYLLTLYGAIRAGESRHRAAWSAAAVASCALGMATKEVMVTAPLVVAAWEWLFRRERPRWGLVAGLAATWLVFAAVIASEQRAPSIAFSPEMAWRYLLTQAGVIAHYVRLAVYPSPLVFLYDWPLAASIREAILPGALVLAAVAATIIGLVRRSHSAFLGAAFFLVLAPTSSVIPIVTEVAAEHRMYLPLASLIAGAALAFHAAAVRLPRRAQAAAGLAIAAALVLFYGVETRARNRDYWSEIALWKSTVEAHPQGQRARVAYGSALASARRFPEAEEQFRAAIALNGSDPIAHTRLGSVLAAREKFDEALPHFERAAELRPGDVDAHYSLGRLYAMRREDARAVEHLGRAADVLRSDPALLARLAAILADSRDPAVRDNDRALRLAAEAVRLTSRQDPASLEILSAALAGAGRFDEAVATVREALALARRQGNGPLAARLEYRMKAYEARRSGRPAT